MLHSSKDDNVATHWDVSTTAFFGPVGLTFDSNQDVLNFDDVFTVSQCRRYRPGVFWKEKRAPWKYSLSLPQPAAFCKSRPHAVASRCLLSVINSLSVTEEIIPGGVLCSRETQQKSGNRNVKTHLRYLIFCYYIIVFCVKTVCGV